MTTIDEIKRFDLKITQPRQGYRFSLDPLLLVDFASGSPDVHRIADLGTGCGVMTLMLARVYPDARICAFESNPEMAELARHNALQNRLTQQVEIHGEDILQHKRLHPVSSFDLVVSNPPFRTPQSGRVSPLKGRDTARHESTAGLADFLAAAKYLVKPGGRICFVHHPSRLTEFISVSTGMKLALVRLQMVHGRSGLPATMFLAELVKGRRETLTVMPPLVIYQDDGSYTHQAMQLLTA